MPFVGAHLACLFTNVYLKKAQTAVGRRTRSCAVRDKDSQCRLIDWGSNTPRTGQYKSTVITA